MSNAYNSPVLFAHPGEILYEEWLKPLGITQFELSKAILLSPRKISEISTGKCPITANIALRLGAFFGTDAESWLNLQSHYDMQKTKQLIEADLQYILDFQ
ncbi:HigA family addiction module antitoxin [Mannheimia massilioguelmaensis]|uniref:HigA family addiction module antitoxin n=1 Tax=Mannheimia massilioguelmaensis TaxID=1604354 RepID=UPI0005C9D4F1|nr:HigA family addiction module antitoxin [Mannheimia massilioguelmaensis]